MHRLFRPETTSDKGLVELAQDRTAPKGMLFHHAAEGKPLATPWQVASLRAALLAAYSLPDGYIVDCACGSGVQLAAYATTLRRAVLGVELDEGRARASAVNLKTVVDHHRASASDWYRSSIILSGDGTDPEGVFSTLEEAASIAFLHLDPARPRNSRTHDLSEMQPPLSAVLSAWAPFFATDVLPNILLDLSPRLTTAQQQDVEAKVDEIWPGLPRTWEWTSRGRGRVDRLALWLGGVADIKASKRFVRVPPSLGQKARTLSTSAVSEAPVPLRHPPKRGEYVSILDAALMESGLMDAWLNDVLPNVSYRWGVVSGRRPQLHHDQALRLSPEDTLLVQASGRVVGLVRMRLDETTVDELVAAAIEHNFSSLTLRLDLPPESQPRLQGSLDRQLRRRGGEREGFVALHPDGEVLLLCVSQTDTV